MKKILLAMALSLSFGAAHAQDEFIKKTLKYCSDNGGTSKIEKTTQTANKECFKILCYKAVGIPDGVNLGGSIDDIRSKLTGAGAAVLAFEPNACRDYKEPTVDDLINGSGNGNGNGTVTNGSGNGNGNGTVTNGSGNGNGNGNGTVTNGSGNGNGNGNGTVTNGSGNGNGNGNGNGGVVVLPGGGIRCDFGEIPYGHPCLKYCKKNIFGREGIERRKCRECVERYSVENGGDLVVDWDAIIRAGGKKPNKASVKVTGVGHVSNTVCYDIKTGEIVYRTPGGTSCPGGSSTVRPGTVTYPGGVHTHTTNTGSGPGTSPGSINVNVTGTGTGAGALPSYCYTGKKSDQKKCDAFIQNTARFACASGGNLSTCIGSDNVGRINGSVSSDGCINCGGARSKDNSWIGEAVSGGLHAVAQGLTGYFGARAFERAATKGFEQCQINNNNYLQYTQANELGAVSPEQFAAMGCNGFQLGGYAGLGSGMMGGWLGGGYTPGFLGGYMGPYGGYNPYGGGATFGGYQGGWQGGYQAGWQGGYQGGGFINGISVAGGYFPGGYQGGYQAGWQGGFQGGGWQGGYQAGWQGGFQGGGWIQGGAGGWIQGGAGGWQGGNQAGWQGGFQGGGWIQGGAGGWAQGGGWQGGYNPGGYYPGGWGSGAGQWGGQGNYWASQQASNYDAMLQGQGVSYQMGMSNGSFGGNYGGYNAGFYPSNLAGSFGVQFNAGLYGP